MPFDLTAVLLIYFAPLAIAITAGLWLVLLVGFGLPVFLGRIQTFTGLADKTFYLVVLTISWGGVVILLLDFYIGLWLFDYPSVVFLTCWNPLLHLAQDYHQTATVFADWWTQAPLVWTILAAEGPLVPLACFGTPAAMRLFSIAEDRSMRVAAGTTRITLLMGIMTALLGFSWPIWTAFSNPDGLWEHIRLGLRLSPLLLSLCPVNLLLAIGFSIWLVVAGDRRVEATAGAVVTVAIAVAAIIAGAIGVILSALYIQSV